MTALEKELCEFIINPAHNPYTGRSINPGKKTYDELVFKCKSAGHSYVELFARKGPAMVVVKPKGKSFKSKENALRKQMNVCSSVISTSKIFIDRDKCQKEEMKCPKTIIDLKTGKQRPLASSNRLPSCQEWVCVIKQASLQNENYRKMLDSDRFTGISGTSEGRPFTEEDLDELRTHISCFCTRQMGDLTDSVFGLNTQKQRMIGKP